jgi:hypothetical protein
MPLPQLNDWKRTSLALHQVVSLVGPIHKALLTQRKNYLHLPMEVRREGLKSQSLPGGSSIQVEFEAGVLTYSRTDGGSIRFDIAHHTQRSLFEALLNALRGDGLGPFLGSSTASSMASGLVERLEAEGKAGASLTLEGLTGDDPLIMDPGAAGAFSKVLFAVFSGLARFRTRLEGHLTPLIVWPEHFDLSTLWFHPSNPGMDDHGPHLSFGFAPFTPGQYEYPYLYAYAFPYPESFNPPTLPEPAFWHDEGWQGAVVRYEDFAQMEDAE